MTKLKYSIHETPWCVLINIILAYLCYAICRVAFILDNYSLFQGSLSADSLALMWKGGLLFDSSAIFYTNSLYILLMLFPLHFKESPSFWRFAKWLFVIINTLCIVMNLMDTVYFPYSQQRATVMVFDEFKNEDNLLTIFGVEFVRHWYFVVLAAVMVFGLWKLYASPSSTKNGLVPTTKKAIRGYYIRQSVSLVVMAFVTIFAMRGATFFTSTRPIAINTAFQYAEQPLETGIVLNTPFALIRTITEKPMQTPIYFTDQSQLDKLYSPVHYPVQGATVRKKNVVILIVESFAQEFVGGLNKGLDGGRYKGYTPFADSLLTQSLSFKQTFANSGFSIDAMPSVLTSIPRMGKPFVLTPYSLNTINGLPKLLRGWGYQTAFFHGADNSSMGFQAYARTAGFSRYYGRTEYNRDRRFGGDKDFDGTWGVWDEPFLQYFCLHLSDLRQPFMASVFTLSSHHPFRVPDKYKNVFKDEGIHKLHKCIRYTDYSLRRFFQTAAKQPWYKNTIFIITADHASSKTTHAMYKTELGHFRIPIIIFDPSAEMPRGHRDGIAQQIDIMPTVLDYLGYDKPYFAFGKDLLRTKPSDSWAFNWDHIPQYIHGDYLLQFDGTQVTALYNYIKDPLLKNNLKGRLPSVEKSMEDHAKAFIQSYMVRMKNNDVSIKNKKRTK